MKKPFSIPLGGSYNTRVTASGAGNFVGQTAPHTWADTDQLFIDFDYPIT